MEVQHQGVKETFIHNGSRGRDGQMGGEDSQQGRGGLTRETKDSKLLDVESCGGGESERNVQSHRVGWEVGLDRNK